MEYELIRSKRKTIAAEIKDGRLIIRAPKLAPKAAIDLFIAKHRKWIDSHLEISAARQAGLAALPKLTGEELRALSEEASLGITQG